MDLLSEELTTLAQARRDLIPSRNGKPVSPCTLWRWIYKGLRLPDGSRVHLEVVQIGGTPMTSREALARFFRRLTEARRTQADQSEEPTERSDTTHRRLERAGLL